MIHTPTSTMEQIPYFDCWSRLADQSIFCHYEMFTLHIIVVVDRLGVAKFATRYDYLSQHSNGVANCAIVPL